ncbi:MAG: hypothetical protein AAGF47_01920 [Planctomycetota bacterium]
MALYRTASVSTSLLAALLMTAGTASAQMGGAPVQPAEDTASQPAADLPDGFAVLEKHIEATGGAEAGLALQGLRMAGSFSMPAMGMSGEITINMKAPKSQVMQISLGAFGSIVQGTNGEVAWASQPGMPAAVMSGPEAEQMIEQADFYGRFKPREQYTSATTTGTEDIDGVTHFRVESVSKNGSTSTGLYHAETGLQHSETTTDAAGNVASQITFLDYREVGELVMPFKMQITQGPMAQEIEFTEITPDPEFDPGLFTPPGGN